MDRQTKSCFNNNRLLLFYHQIVTKPPEFERFPEMGESSLTESDSDYMEPVMYTSTAGSSPAPATPPATPGLLPTPPTFPPYPGTV